MAKTNNTNVKHISVALQGGGSHGAFTWGVLDRLLQQEDLVLDGFCGTSAGAMNATILAHGLQLGGREKARELLKLFWTKISKASAQSMMQPTWLDKMMGKGNMDFSPGYMLGELMGMFLSPYQTGMGDVNPLKDILLSIVDFEKLKSCTKTKLFVCATDVKQGKAKVFDMTHISVDAVMASGCLPFMFKAVNINGVDYWDGGYMGNPPISPLINQTDTTDILIVQINPIVIKETPTTPIDIRDRVNEINFNASLILEMDKLELISRMIDAGVHFDEKLFRKIHIHNINPESDIAHYNVSSKINASAEFLEYLFHLGTNYADQWLAKNYNDIGKKSTCDVKKTFL